MSLLLIAPSAPAGPVPVVSRLSVSSYQTLCNKGALPAAYQMSWSLANAGAPGFMLGVYVNGVLQTTLDDSTTSYIFDTGTAGTSGTQTPYDISLKVIRTSTGAVLQTVLNGSNSPPSSCT